MQDRFEPDYQLDRGDQANLAAIVPMPGFKVLNRMMRSEADKFFIRLFNTKNSNREEVIANHGLAQVAAQFYQAVVDRVNEEVTQYVQAPRADDKPVDVTSNLDMGDIAAQLNDVPNLLGGEQDFE